MERRPLHKSFFAVAVLAAIAAATVLAAAASSPSAASLDQRSQKLQVALDRVVAAGAPAAVALRRDGARTTTYHSGYGNLATKTPVQASERFRVGSVTKTFVATVALQLIGENKLSLEDSIERWLPGLVPNGENITVKQLLNHTSASSRSSTTRGSRARTCRATAATTGRRGRSSRSPSRTRRSSSPARAGRTRARTTSSSASSSKRLQASR